MSIWNRRIPTILAIILLVVGVGVTTLLVRNTTNFFGHAAPPETPEDVRITNVTDSTFSFTYKTEAQVIGTLHLVDADTTQQALDDRDQDSGVPKEYFLHSITVKNLKPDTTYSFSVVSGQTTFDNNGIPFSVKTGPTLTATPSGQVPLSGRIVNPDGSKPEETLIFVTTANGQTLSTLLKSSGIYILPLNLLRSSDLTKLITLTQDMPLQILAKSPDNSSQALILPTTINPVPAITLSQNYDFTLSTTPLATSEASTVKFPTFSLDTNVQATPQILIPKAQESFSDQQPTFSGTALPNQTVSITVHSTDQLTTQIKANASGNWTYRPDKPLSPGQHILTITTADKFGILRTIQQGFTVYASGSQVNESATPSGQLVTPTPTPIPKQPILTPTPTPTISQTKGGLSLSPTPSPKPTLPPTGSNTLVITAVTGITTTIVGILVFFLTRGATL